MIVVTEKAQHYLKGLVDEKSNALGFKLSVKTVGCSGYAYDPQIINEMADNDIELEQQGVRIFVDKQWQTILNGTTVDLVSKGLGQTQIVFDCPNVDATCGCGESFSLKQDEC